MTDIAAVVAAAASSRGIGSNGKLVRILFSQEDLNHDHVNNVFVNYQIGLRYFNQFSE